MWHVKPCKPEICPLKELYISELSQVEMCLQGMRGQRRPKSDYHHENIPI